MSQLPVALHPYLDHPGPLPIAHRGGALEAPENSLVAFQRAVALGFGWLETDVHATSDGVLVAFHDDRLDRLTDGTGVISELPWSQVAQACIDGSEPVPRLVDLLEALPAARVNIDVKSPVAVGPLVELLNAHPELLTRVCVGSFSPRRLNAVRNGVTGSRLATSCAPSEVARLLGGAQTRGLVWWSSPAVAAQVPERSNGIRIVSPRSVAYAHSRGLAVHVWTINDDADMHRLLDWGVDGIVTDRPILLRQVLKERGVWFGN